MNDDFFARNSRAILIADAVSHSDIVDESDIAEIKLREWQWRAVGILVLFAVAIVTWNYFFRP